MSFPISNAKDRPLNVSSGTIPDVGDALANWFQPMQFTTVAKTVEGFVVKETPTTVDFRGVIQPFSSRQLSLKPEGERAWNWWMLHAEPACVLQPDDVVVYLGVQYRVMAQSDYRIYGYVQYELREDFTGSGP